MSEEPTRRDLLKMTARGVAAAAVGGPLIYLAGKAGAEGAWLIDTKQCLNSKLGVIEDYCDKCATTCVLPLSAVRVVNEFSKCGRCCICPAYFDVTSETGPDGLPMGKLCPRDAIDRTPIGEVDPYDPLNNFYEYTIDEERCNGCGKCVMACKEPAGLGSLRLEVRHDLCTDCNRCAIAMSCPEEALVRDDWPKDWT